MKRIYPLLSVLATVAVMSSCEDMMDTDTTTYRYENGIKFENAADSLYSAMGILSQMQALGERYVLFGELRGDLMKVTDEADFSLREISEFNISADNEYLSTRDYYSVINNCNYALSKIDTEVTIHGTKVLMPEYVAIRTMRAWTYLQMGLNFGSVKYITEPILSLDASLKDFSTIELDQLVPMLIADIEPFASVDTPNYGNVDGQDSRNFFIQPRLLLADLYLYDNRYEEAAQMYYNYIERFRVSVSYSNGNRWTTSNQDGSYTEHMNTYANEVCSMIPYSSDAEEYHPNLVNLTYHNTPSLIPADWWVNEMNDADYYHADNMSVNIISGYLQGDLRGMLLFRNGRTEIPSTFGNVQVGLNTRSCLITKFYNNASAYSSITSPDNELFSEASPRLLCRVAVERVPHIYLRYAEAVNRAGKPTLAFAVLKYGLNREYMTMEENPVVNPDELASGEPWANFAVLDLDNTGTAMRGRGLGIRLDGSGYVIPELASRADSIDFVEGEILREMAAETAFEGNRFFDLLRVSRHRADHPALMIEKISARFENSDAIKARLKDRNNWWIK